RPTMRVQHHELVVRQLSQSRSYGGPRALEYAAQRRLGKLSPREETAIHDCVEYGRVDSLYLSLQPGALQPRGRAGRMAFRRWFRMSIDTEHERRTAGN